MEGIDQVNIEHFFDFDDGGGYSLRGHGPKVKV